MSETIQAITDHQLVAFDLIVTKKRYYLERKIAREGTFIYAA